MRINCGCKCESETEVSRSSHSACDYVQQSEKQLKYRLLPQPVDASYTEHFADYSGCSHTPSSHSHSLLVSSTQNIDYEEVLCISVPSRRENVELNYACVNDNVIRKPPCSIGIVNNNFSEDTSSSNNNLLQPEASDSVLPVQDGKPQDRSGSDVSSDVSSTSSSNNDHNSAEVKYVADIKQFQSTQTSTRPHGEDCCCRACQSVNDEFNRTEDDESIHHNSELKCSCKSCREFYSRMQHTNGGFATTVGIDAFANQYRLVASIAQDDEDVPLTWSQSLAVCKIAESASFDSHNSEPTHESASVLANNSDLVIGALAPEEVDDDDELFSGDDELHYVFHKFIDDSCLEVPFTEVSTDDRHRPSAALNRVVQSESGAELEHRAARSADDLEVAFFMVGSISPSSPSDIFIDGSHVTSAVPASVTVSIGHQTAVSEDTITSETELTARSYNFVTEPSAYHESLSAAENGSELYITKDIETDTFAKVLETSTLRTSSASPCELENRSDALRIEEDGLENDFFMYSDLSVFVNENQQTDSNEVRRDVIVQKLSDSSSLVIELPAADDEVVSAICSDVENISISTSEAVDATYTADELVPTVDDDVVEQKLMPECISDHPVLTDEVNSSAAGDDVSYGYSQQHATADVAPYIRDIVTEAVRKIADDASVEICTVASEDEDMSSKWPKQILITSAPLPSTYHRLATEDEHDRYCENLSRAADDMAPQLVSGRAEYFSVGTPDIDVRDTDVDISDEAVCTEAQEVPLVENYLISYDVHLFQRPVNDNADPSVDQTLIWSAHSTCLDKDFADGDVKLQDLVQPLEHVTSESKEDVMVDSEDYLTSLLDAGQAASAATFGPTDIVEDFFMQYVLSADSVSCSKETDTAATTFVLGEQCEDASDQSEVDKDEDLIQAKKLEITAEDIVDVIISDAVAEAEVYAAATSAGFEDVVDQPEGDRDLQGLDQAEESETITQTRVDVIISDTSGELSTDRTSSLAADGDDTQLAMPTKPSCLLHSPSESHRKKSVHFADTHGLQLETVQCYVQAPEPEESLASLEEFLSKLSSAAAERRAKWTEWHPSRATSWFGSSSIYLLACFELPSTQEELLERVQQCRVALESCSFDDLALAISGVVRVANIAFNKKIIVRFSVDRWTTQTDTDGEYIPRSNDGTTDRFSFTIILPSRKQFVIGSEVEFAICYVAGDGPSFELWDNNHGRNYVVRCCSKAASRDVRNVNTGTDDGSNGNDVSE